MQRKGREGGSAQKGKEMKGLESFMEPKLFAFKVVYHLL